MTSWDTTAARGTMLVGLGMTGALCGFFYAWICSTMWGLDAIDPRVAIAAMKGMNASVRNAVFFPVFFLTAPVLAIATLLSWRAGHNSAAKLLGAAAITVLFGCTLLTMTVHIPLNESLALTEIPTTEDEAAQIWAAYSPRWQVYNTLRAALGGVALIMVGMALLRTPT